MKKAIFGLALGMISSGALAQSVVISTESVGIGATTVDVTVSWSQDGGPSVLGWGMNLQYDSTKLTFDNNGNNPPADGVSDGCVATVANCLEQGAAGSITIGGFGNPTEGVVATITFGIVDSTMEDMIPLTAMDPAFNAGAGDVMLPVTEGAVNIVAGPSLAATNSPVAITIPTNGSDTSNLDFAASNGTVTGIMCTAAGDGEISFDTSGVPASTDGTFSVPATCSAGAAGSYTSDLTCAYDGGMAVGTVNCDAADGLPVVATDPANGGTLVIGGLLPGGTGSRPVTFSETGGAGSGEAYTVTGCSITGTDFSLSDTMASVPFGGSASITVTADGPRAVVTETLTCTVNGAPYSIDVTVNFRPLVVPTLQQWGMILMVLSLAAFGFVTLRRRGEI